MTLYKLNRVLHRDLGYFFVAMILIYAISGIAINHKRDWNPNYIITDKDIELNRSFVRDSINQTIIDDILVKSGEKGNYKSHFFPDNETLRIFVEDGTITVDLPDGATTIETIKKRPLFKEMNFLHYNPGVYWTWFSDFFCVALIFLAISGLFILKGKNGLKWRGTIFMVLGIVVPLIFLFLYL